ncbi:MAG: hypothetical protein VX640_08145 [Pseudomonadota bacterium]|nr:hypothetical protein [Pseudomonadota bacterium]
MTAGRDALHRLDAEIAAARKAIARASDTAAEDARLHAALETREIDAFRALAEIRLDLLRKDEIETSLGAADRKAKELMAAHEAHIAELAEARDNAANEIARLEADRRRAEETLAAAVERHESAAAATRRRLEEDPAYETLASALEEANAIARRAEQKLELARADRKEKGAPYEADPLFAYLHKRQYGARGYRAFPLFALLDGWVARLVGYREARLNYARLLELPERLGEHVARVEEAAAERARAVEAYEREALEADGVGALRDEAAKAQAALEALDGAIAAAEKRGAELQARFNEAAAGRSGPLAEARAIVAQTLERKPIPDLKVLAAETETLDDDRLVDELITIRRERMELEESRRASGAALERRTRGLGDLEDIRRRFKQARYDSPYSEFPGGDLIGALALELLRGALTRDAVWRKIEKSQRTRRRDWDDDFGGRDWRGGFGVPGNWGGGGWDPGRGGMPRPPRAPRPPRIGGGFRTGGGMRGGGFKTGGGF